MSKSEADVVFGLSLETWNDVVRREFARPPDRVVQHAMRDEQVRRLLVVNPWRSVGSQVKRRLGSSRDARFPKTDTVSLLRPVRLRRSDPISPAALTRTYRSYSALIRQAARRRGLTGPHLVTYNPLLAGFGDHRGYASVTYLARDDWAVHHGVARFRDAYLDAYERIREQRMRVCAVSEVLLARIAPTGDALVVPNGIDPQVWATAGPAPLELAGLPRPIALYAGTIDERISVDALAAVSRAIPHGTIVLLGPYEDDRAAMLRRRLGNVHLTGPMKQSKLAGYVAAADVCLLPHVRSPLTQAMSPLKVYEYLAAGRPVVATDLPPVRDISPSIVLVDDDEQFGDATLAALAAGPMAEGDRLAFIAANSWASRCSLMLDLALR